MTRAKNRSWVRATEIQKDIDTGKHFVLVEYTDLSGQKATTRLPRSQMDDPRGAKRELAELGAAIPEDWLDDLKATLATHDVPLILTTQICGWHDRTYVLKDEVIGTLDIRPPRPDLKKKLCCGSTKDWRTGLGDPCAASSILTFAIAAAFAGPLLRPLKMDEGATFHLFGTSSTGKSLSTIAALSAFEGAHRGQLRTFDLTSRAMEEAAEACNDGLFVLDEAGRLDQQAGRRRAQFSELAYKIAGGRGRERSNSVASQGPLKNVEYRVIGLSSGEERLEKQGSAGRNGGEQVRLIGVPVPDAGKGGIFDLESSPVRRRQLAVQVEQVISENHGWPIRRFLKQFLADKQGVEKAAAHVDKFVQRAVPSGDSYAQRFARKFGVVYAAAMLAVDYRVAPWSRKHAGQAIRKVCQSAWGEVRPAEVAVDRLLHDLLRNAGKPRLFPTIEGGDRMTASALRTAWGIRRSIGGHEYLAVFRSKFSEIVGAHDRHALAILHARGLIADGKEDRLYIRALRIKGMPNKRTSVILFDLAAMLPRAAGSEAA